MSSRKSGFRPALKVGRDISFIDFIKTRLVTPREIMEGIKEPVYRNTSIGRILFNARYRAGKALEGYDFMTVRGSS